MATSDNSAEKEPHAVIRSVKKLDNGEWDTNVLLFKGKGDFLQGFIKVGDEKRHVIAHLNERKPDQETGEIKPNFITLTEAQNTGDETTWKQIGYGNAVNRRTDNKPVYFDEVLFSVGNQLVGGRVTRHCDDELHRKLGFIEDRKPRPPKEDNKSSANKEDTSPKPTAPAAKPKEDAAGAPKARRSSRAKA